MADQDAKGEPTTHGEESNRQQAGNSSTPSASSLGIQNETARVNPAQSSSSQSTQHASIPGPVPSSNRPTTGGWTAHSLWQQNPNANPHTPIDRPAQSASRIGKINEQASSSKQPTSGWTAHTEWLNNSTDYHIPTLQTEDQEEAKLQEALFKDAQHQHAKAKAQPPPSETRPDAVIHCQKCGHDFEMLPRDMKYPLEHIDPMFTPIAMHGVGTWECPHCAQIYDTMRKVRDGEQYDVDEEMGKGKGRERRVSYDSSGSEAELERLMADVVVDDSEESEVVGGADGRDTEEGISSDSNVLVESSACGEGGSSGRDNNGTADGMDDSVRAGGGGDIEGSTAKTDGGVDADVDDTTDDNSDTTVVPPTETTDVLEDETMSSQEGIWNQSTTNDQWNTWEDSYQDFSEPPRTYFTGAGHSLARSADNTIQAGNEVDQEDVRRARESRFQQQARSSEQEIEKKRKRMVIQMAIKREKEMKADQEELDGKFSKREESGLELAARTLRLRGVYQSESGSLEDDDVASGQEGSDQTTETGHELWEDENARWLQEKAAAAGFAGGTPAYQLDDAGDDSQAENTKDGNTDGSKGANGGGIDGEGKGGHGSSA